ncbi:solute carrier family 23 protein [Escherichia coli]
MSAIDSQLPSSSGQDRPTDEVDRILSPGKLIILGLQHVLVMYAGAVAVPLMIGDLWLFKEAIAMLISSDLFCCGIVTLLQCIGIGRFMGIRLPVIMSVTFAAVTPMIAIGMTGYRPAGDIWCHYRRGFYHHIISATYWSLDAFIPATGYRCGYYFYWA